MALVVIGIDHRNASLALLERLSITEDRRPKLLVELRDTDQIDEAVVLSTCMRTEIYVQSERFHSAVADVRDVLSRLCDVPIQDFSDQLLTYFDEAGVEHLFRVAAGVDSAVLGEGEILRQVHDAWWSAKEEHASGPVLAQLFRQAVEVGKRVRSETAIARGTTSVSQAAVNLAANHRGTLDDANVVVLGAGEMGAGMAHALRKAARVANVGIVNRTLEHAEAVANEIGGGALPLTDVEAAIANADVVLSSTGATEFVIDNAMLTAVMAERPERAMLIIDVAVPRDIDPTVADVPGVTLLSMDDLRAFAEAGRAQRQGEIEQVEKITEEEVLRYSALVNTNRVTPLVKALHDQGEALRTQEMTRYQSRLASLSDDEREAVESLTRSLVKKILHRPTIGLKDAAATSRGERMLDAFRELYDLDE